MTKAGAKGSKRDEDIKLARQECEELENGRTESFEKAYTLYNPIFLSFARIRLYEPNDAGDVVSAFWLEVVKSKSFCVYEGKKNASLKVFLLNRLYQRIRDSNRKTERERKWLPPQPVKLGGEGDSDTGPMGGDDNDIISVPEKPPEDLVMGKLVYETIHEALLELARLHILDAIYVQMFLEEKTYQEMALATDDKDDPESVRKNVNRIKKQFTREETGSLVRFKAIFLRVLESKGIDPEDVSDWVSSLGGE